MLEKLAVSEKCDEDWQNQLSTGSGMDKPRFWPENDYGEKHGKPTYKQTITQIKDVVVTKKRPILLTFCAVMKPEFRSTKQCSDAGFGHALVIEGYRQMCDRKGTCVDSLKVRNSWGDNWQKENNDGWVDAKTLVDATFYDQQPLTWLEKTPPIQY